MNFVELQWATHEFLSRIYHIVSIPGAAWYEGPMFPPSYLSTRRFRFVCRLVLDVCVRVVQEYHGLVEGGCTADRQGGATDVVDYPPGSTGLAALPTDEHVPGMDGTVVVLPICFGICGRWCTVIRLFGRRR